MNLSQEGWSALESDVKSENRNALALPTSPRTRQETTVYACQYGAQWPSVCLLGQEGELMAKR